MNECAAARQLRPRLLLGALVVLATSVTAGALLAAEAAVIGKTFAESTPAPMAKPVVREDAPNVLVWMIDDLGFGQIGSFGGVIDTPSIDRLAQRGLRYINYHTQPICSASRAALLTGRNSHNVHIGGHSAMAIGFPGLDGKVPRAAGTIANNLGKAGYLTYAIGKWDHMPPEDASPAGPFTYWPSGQGFDRFYGFLSFDADNFAPPLWRDHQPVNLPNDPDYHLSTDMADRAIEWINMRDAGPVKPPFFMYWATGAVHSPHHAPDSYLKRYRGKFDEGWDAIRERVLARQKALGIVPASTRLPPRPAGMKAWSEMSRDEQRLAARAMEAFAAQLTHADEEFGRILDVLEQRGELDNTIVIVTSDNGASAEGGPDGLVSEHLMANGFYPTTEQNMKFFEQWGGPDTYPHYPFGWAVAGNTPFRYYKQTAYEGGVRVPLIVHWPRGIAQGGGVRNQFHHVIDITPSVLDMAGVEPASRVNDVEQMPFDGISFAYSFDQPQQPSMRITQYFEMYGNRALWHEGWKAVMPHRLKVWDFMNPAPMSEEGWQLYNLAEDVNELNDLASEQPERLARLRQLFDREARRYNVYPLTNTGDAQRVRMAAYTKSVAERDGTWHYPQPVTRVPEANAPPMHNHSWRLDAELTADRASEGVVFARGGHHGGMALQLRRGVPEFVMRNIDLSLFRLSAKRAIEGDARVSVDFSRLGRDAAEVVLLVDDQAVARGRIESPLPSWIISNSDGFDIGSDTGSTVVPGVSPGEPFTGTIRGVKVRVREE